MTAPDAVDLVSGGPGSSGLRGLGGVFGETVSDLQDAVDDDCIDAFFDLLLLDISMRYGEKDQNVLT